MKIIGLVSLICLSWFAKGQSNISVKKYFQREFIEEKYHNQADKLRALEEIGFDGNENLEVSDVRSLNTEDEALQVGAEPHIAINPNDANHIVVTFMSVGGEFEFPVYYSFDAGETWAKSDYSIASSFKTHMGITAELEHGGDPILAFDNNGKLYFSWLFVHDDIGTTGFVYSNDGGITFNEVSEESIVNSGSTQQMEVLDREWLAVDNSGGEKDGTLYMSAFYLGQSFNANGQIVLTKPSDSDVFNTSVSSAAPFNQAAMTAPQFGNIKVDGMGNIHVSCMQYNPQTGAGTIVYSKSNDGASSFVETEIATNSTQTNGNAILHARENAAVGMDIDGDNVYVTWTDYSDNEIKSYYVYSNNNGVDWSEAILLNTLLGDTKYCLMPNVSADNGKMTISFYAVEKTTKIGSYFIVSSSDMGHTLGAAVEISSVNTDFYNVPDAEFMGDYNTSLMQGCNVYSVWSNKTGSQIKIYIGKTDVCAITGIVEYNTVNGSFSLEEVYPNPIKEDLNLNLSSSKFQQVNLEILSLDGKIVLDKTFDVNEGNNKLNTKVSKLSEGAYLLKISNNVNDILTKKIIKL